MSHVTLQYGVEQGGGLAGVRVLREFYERLDTRDAKIETPLVVAVYFLQEAVADGREGDEVGVREIGVAFIVFNYAGYANVQGVARMSSRPMYLSAGRLPK